MPKLGDALTAPKEEVRQMVEEAVSNSPDLITAMESIGAMYGIPSTNIMENPNAKKISIMNDTIVCPSGVKANGNTTAIMRSISGVLDQISKRVDDKITDIQTTNINNGQHDESLLNRMDPSKGKVVITTVDANGEPVIVYDSGIIDCAHTPAGRAKADELRSQGNIPTFDPLKKEKPSYFNDDDDVLKGVDMNASDKNLMQHVTECDYADVCGVPGYYIDAIAKNGDTRTLGYAILSRQGYDVQPMYDTYMEAANVKSLNPEDLKHMKFDNRNILEAVEYLNEARKAQPTVTKTSDLNMDELVNHPGYKKAIICLEKQFDCHLAIKWIHANQKESMAGTAIIDTEYRTKLTCSKSKGFQLGGAPIHIYVVENGVADLIPDDPDLFGQSVISILLHEIFHNIAGIMRYETGQFITTLNIAINEAAATRDMKTRRVIIEKYVESLNTQMKGKMNRTTRRLLTKRLLNLVNEQSNVETKFAASTAETPEQRKQNAEAELKAYTKTYKKFTKRSKPAGKGLGITGMILGGLNIIVSIIGFASGMVGIPLVGVVVGLAAIGIGIGGFASDAHYKKLVKMYKNTREMEEYYADLMTGMYQLPQRFFNAASRRKYSANDVSQETLNEWVKVEKCAYESILFAQYPTTSERTYAGVRVAQNLLTCDHLDPAVERYLKWVVENNDQILKTGIDKDYNTHTFDPAEAEDLDKHLVSMVKNNKVTVTESYAEELLFSSTPVDEYDDIMQEFCELTDHINFATSMMMDGYFDHTVTEAYATKITGYKDESVGKRIIMAIPRLIKKLIDSYCKLCQFIYDKIMIGVHKVLYHDKTYTTKYDLKWMDERYTKIGALIDKCDEILTGATSVEDYAKRMLKVAEIDLTEIKEHAEREKHETSMNGKEISKILKHIVDYTRRDIVPKLRRLNEQHDRIIKASADKWTELKGNTTEYKDLMAGSKTFAEITKEAQGLTASLMHVAEAMFSARQPKNAKPSKKAVVLDNKFIDDYKIRHDIDGSEAGIIAFARASEIFGENPDLRIMIDETANTASWVILFKPHGSSADGNSVELFEVKELKIDTIPNCRKSNGVWRVFVNKTK